MSNVISVGANPTPIWGLTNHERIMRLAVSLAHSPDEGDDSIILANDDYVIDPLLLSLVASKSAAIIIRDGVPILAKIATEQRQAVEAAMRGEKLNHSIEQIVVDDQFTLYDRKLRKRVHPVAMRLEPGTVRVIERATYDRAYKGVTDLLTKYLWPSWAFVLTRMAAALGMSPNFVTAIGFINCIAAGVSFWFGQYWLGMAFALLFMVLDTVDGKLARCTITSSKLGSRFDHNIDLVHPPLWWWAWAHGLGSWGLALSPSQFTIVMSAIIGGYVVDRAVERYFILRFGFHIHVWRKLDSDFRLVAARRNPNMVILFVATLFRRPDIGIVAVAAWTILSLVFHAVRLIQAESRRARGAVPASWLS